MQYFESLDLQLTACNLITSLEYSKLQQKKWEEYVITNVTEFSIKEVKKCGDELQV